MQQPTGKRKSEFVDSKGRLIIERATPLRAVPAAVAADDTVGGLRCSRMSVERVPDQHIVGGLVGRAIDEVVSQADNRPRPKGELTFSEAVEQSIGAPEGQEQIDEAVIDAARLRIAGIVKCSDWEPINEDGFQTDICGHLLHAWAVAGADPAAEVAKWTWEGSPA